MRDASYAPWLEISPTVNRTPPPGRAWGQRCECSPWSALRLEKGEGAPPRTGIEKMGALAWGEKARVSPSSQVTPRGSFTSVRTTGAPSSEATLSLLPAKNAIDRPLGEKLGLIPPSVPGTRFATGLLRSRRYRCCAPSRRAAYTMRLPSREMSRTG